VSMVSTKIARWVRLTAGLALIAVALMACGGTTSNNTSGKKTYQIAIVLSATISVVDAMVAKFKDTLAQAGLDVNYTSYNGQGQNSNAVLIAKEAVEKKPDLIYVVGTPYVIALAQQTKTIPIVFALMTDPVAGKVVQSLDHPGGNLTGTTDAVDVSVYFDLIHEVMPNVKNVGMIGNVSEQNSSIFINQAKQVASQRSIGLLVSPINSTNDILPAIKSLKGRVEILFTSNDNTVVSAIGTVVQVTISQGMPLITTGSFGDQGAMLGIGSNIPEHGVASAQEVLQILQHGAKPANIPVYEQSVKDVQINVNVASAKKLGITIPASVLSRATVVGQ
jgi:putative tryptophan/tyrosine transport system substrate-binding protein